VVVFSEDDSPKLIEEAKRLSAAAYLIKAHLLPRRLSETVRDILSNRGRHVETRKVLEVS
jgi:DNA-binding NarL/FixJ family response regulator